MALKDKLTCESIVRKFKSPFELADYAIKVATNILDTGRRANVDVDVTNPARIALEEIEADRVEFAVLQDDLEEASSIESMESAAAELNSMSSSAE